MASHHTRNNNVESLEIDSRIMVGNEQLRRKVSTISVDSTKKRRDGDENWIGWNLEHLMKQ